MVQSQESRLLGFGSKELRDRIQPQLFVGKEKNDPSTLLGPWLGLCVTKDTLTREKHPQLFNGSVPGHRKCHKEMMTQRNGRAECGCTRLDQE